MQAMMIAALPRRRQHSCRGRDDLAVEYFRSQIASGAVKICAWNLSRRTSVSFGPLGLMPCHKAAFGQLIIKKRRSLHSRHRVADETARDGDSACGKPLLRFFYDLEAFEYAVHSAETSSAL
jgi:hypothetical protein